MFQSTILHAWCVQSFSILKLKFSINWKLQWHIREYDFCLWVNYSNKLAFPIWKVKKSTQRTQFNCCLWFFYLKLVVRIISSHLEETCLSQEKIVFYYIVVDQITYNKTVSCDNYVCELFLISSFWQSLLLFFSVIFESKLSVYHFYV